MAFEDRPDDPLAFRGLRFTLNRLDQATRRRDREAVWHHLHAYRAVRTELCERGLERVQTRDEPVVVEAALALLDLSDWV